MEPGWNSEIRMLFLFFTSSSSVVVQRSFLAYVKCSMINCSFFFKLWCVDIGVTLPKQDFWWKSFPFWFFKMLIPYLIKGNPNKHVKNWLLRKDPHSGKDWSQEEKGTTEDEMVGWHHLLDRYEFEQAPGIGEGQGSLASAVNGITKSQTWLSDWTELN